MFCSICGSAALDEGNFCSHCGKPLVRVTATAPSAAAAPAMAAELPITPVAKTGADATRTRDWWAAAIFFGATFVIDFFRDKYHSPSLAFATMFGSMLVPLIGVALYYVIGRARRGVKVSRARAWAAVGFWTLVCTFIVIISDAL